VRFLPALLCAMAAFLVRRKQEQSHVVRRRVILWYNCAAYGGCGTIPPNNSYGEVE